MCSWRWLLWKKLRKRRHHLKVNPSMSTDPKNTFNANYSGIILQHFANSVRYSKTPNFRLPFSEHSYVGQFDCLVRIFLADLEFTPLCWFRSYVFQTRFRSLEPVFFSYGPKLCSGMSQFWLIYTKICHVIAQLMLESERETLHTIVHQFLPASLWIELFILSLGLSGNQKVYLCVWTGCIWWGTCLFFIDRCCFLSNN